MGCSGQRREGEVAAHSSEGTRRRRASRARKDQFLMALGHEDDLLHAFSNGS